MVKRTKPSKDDNAENISTKAMKLTFDRNKIFIGAHVSISNGLFKAFSNANTIGAKAFALFLRNQRQWAFKPVSDEMIIKFKIEAEQNNISLDNVVPHGSYLLNCGSPKEDILTKSRNLFIEELRTCDKLGIKYFNFHPGSTCGIAPRTQTIKLIADSVNLGISKSENVIVLLENMSCQGHTIGGKFDELQLIISQVTNKDRVGVCLDTCHAFAAGFPLHKPGGYNRMMEEFESKIGLKYLKAIHLNDSKVIITNPNNILKLFQGDCGNHLDRHENIGKGKIGLSLFEKMVNDPRLMNIPMILETPGENTYKEQIDLLYGLIKDV